MKTNKNKIFTIAVICGGPSLERGISLNSARSILDHLGNENICILPIYVDYQKNFFQISLAQLYSNTPADFDFKLNSTAILLDSAKLAQVLKKVDLVFPVIHGAFGEGGELQQLLENLAVPFVGSNSSSCRAVFFKGQAAKILQHHNFLTFPSVVLKKNSLSNKKNTDNFFKEYSLTKAVIKPQAAGSSIGVYVVNNVADALSKAQLIFDQGIDTNALIEPFIYGKEFTILVLQNQNNEAVALLPTQIELHHKENGIFDYRHKYLPTPNTFYHTPAKFDDSLIEKIRLQAEYIFNLFKMHDFARFDGWVVDNKVYFTDFNPITGLEQNSFIFRQASLLGLSHRHTLEYVVQSACRRQQLSYPKISPLASSLKNKKSVFVLLGGNTAERQVSLMSGTNVWLKLLYSHRYYPKPFFLDSQQNLWELPYSYALNHTTEEVFSNCQNTIEHSKRITFHTPLIQEKLGINSNNLIPILQPLPLSLIDFAKRAYNEKAFIFIALHGGYGENGALQQFLERYKLPYNGSKAKASRICIDKYITRQHLKKLEHPDLIDLPQTNISLQQCIEFSPQDFFNFWNNLVNNTQCNNFIIKPRTDGCSSGIMLLTSDADLALYAYHFKIKASFINKNTFIRQTEIIELPQQVEEFLLEPYIEVDHIFTDGHKLLHQEKQGWIELTIGILEQKNNYYAFNPSLTIAEGATLSLEEKFQGGTGINITPPPNTIISIQEQKLIKKLIIKVAQTLEISNYARIDIFYNRLSKKIIIIEVNSLPGLTPSTVIYHQALAETPSLSPQKFLEHIIDTAL